LSGVVYQYKGKMPDCRVDSNAVEAEVYLSSGVDSHSTNINLVLEQLPIATPEAAARFGSPPKEGFTIAAALIQPTSRGQVRLASADWRDAPIIEGNHLGTDRDLAAIVRAIEAARELGSKAALDSVREAEVVPGPKATSRQDLTTSRELPQPVSVTRWAPRRSVLAPMPWWTASFASTAFAACAWRTHPSYRRSFRGRSMLRPSLSAAALPS
jgi:choline dehydrogenase-like flavoprotein